MVSSAYDLVKSHYEASDRGDMEGMLAVLGEKARWTAMEGSPCSGTHVGPKEIFENVFQRLGKEWDDYTATLDELIDGGQTVVGLGRYTGTHKETGKSFDARFAHVWRVTDGKVAALEQFTDTLLIARASEQN